MEKIQDLICSFAVDLLPYMDHCRLSSATIHHMWYSFAQSFHRLDELEIVLRSRNKKWGPIVAVHACYTASATRSDFIAHTRISRARRAQCRRATFIFMVSPYYYLRAINRGVLTCGEYSLVFVCKAMLRNMIVCLLLQQRHTSPANKHNPYFIAWSIAHSTY